MRGLLFGFWLGQGLVIGFVMWLRGFALGLHIGSFDRERLADVFFLNA